MLEAIVYLVFCALTGLCGIDRRMGFFGTFLLALSHSICSLARLASYRPIAPRRMASPKLTEVVRRIRQGRASLGRRWNFVEV